MCHGCGAEIAYGPTPQETIRWGLRLALVLFFIAVGATMDWLKPGLEALGCMAVLALAAGLIGANAILRRAYPAVRFIRRYNDIV